LKTASVILAEVADCAGVSSEEIVGPNRSHVVSKARREFYLCAHERTGGHTGRFGQDDREDARCRGGAKKDRDGRK